MLQELKEIVIVSRIAAERPLGVLEQLNLAMDGEHFLDKCSPELQKPKWERAFVVRSEGLTRLFEELAEMRT